MSMHIERVAVSDAVPQVVYPGEGHYIEQALDENLKPGHIGLWVGGREDGTLLEGTRGEITLWLGEALRAVSWGGAER